MNINKKHFIIGCVIVGIILYLLFLYLSPNKNGQLTVNNSTNQEDTLVNDEMTIHPLEEVSNYKEFFTINDILNQYFQNIAEQDFDKAINKIDKNYRNKVDITADVEGTGITFISTDMYSKGINNKYYYFVEGTKQTYHSYLETIKEENNVYFVIILDTSKRIFSIIPADISTNLSIYANTYKMDITEIESNEDNYYVTSKITDENITKYYLNYYKNLLYMNTEKAYNMLTSSTKEQYPSLEIFTNNLETLYTSISTNLLGYQVKGENGKRSYYSLNSKDVRITIDEKSIMDFVVTIDK